MKKYSTFIQISVIIVALVAAGIFGYLIWENQVGEDYRGGLVSFGFRELLPNNEIVYGLDFDAATPAPINAETSGRVLGQTAWIPDWDFYNGYETLTTLDKKLDSVSPVWYHLNKDGTIRVNRVGLAELQQQRREHGTKIIPSIASFSATEFRNATDTPQKLKNHLDFFKQEVEKYNLDGIDLDYESMFYLSQSVYLELIRDLYNYLDERDKILSIAVMPIWTESEIYPTLVQTRRVQNYAVISDYVHEFRIMTYNITNFNSKYPGPIAPMDWVEATLRYARAQVDPDKLYVGIHLYSYGGWGEQNKERNPYLSQYTNPYMEGGQAAALTYSGVIERRRNGEISNKLDPYSGEKIFEYNKDGGRFIGYYMDAETVALRADLAEKYGAAGLAYWRMGDEDIRVYNR